MKYISLACGDYAKISRAHSRRRYEGWEKSEKKKQIPRPVVLRRDDRAIKSKTEAAAREGRRYKAGNGKEPARRRRYKRRGIRRCGLCRYGKMLPVPKPR